MGYAFEDRNGRSGPNPPMMENVVRMSDYKRRPRPGASVRRPGEHCLVVILPRLPLGSREGRRAKALESSRPSRLPTAG